MTTAQTIHNYAYDTPTGEYARPQENYLRANGGVLVDSSNWDADGAQVSSGWSFSPTETWEFPDGSAIEITCQGCGVWD